MSILENLLIFLWGFITLGITFETITMLLVIREVVPKKKFEIPKKIKETH